MSLLRKPRSPRDDGLVSQTLDEGKAAETIAREMIVAAGFSDLRADQRQPGGIQISFVARDRAGRPWAIDVAGSFTSHRSGLKKTDVLWKALAKAAVLREVSETPLLLLTAGLPGSGSPGAKALKQVTGTRKLIHAVIDMRDRSAVEELHAICAGNSGPIRLGAPSGGKRKVKPGGMWLSSQASTARVGGHDKRETLMPR